MPTTYFMSGYSGSAGSIAAAVTLPCPAGGRRLGVVAALVGPDGWRVDQIRITRDGVSRTVLRVRRFGRFIGEVRSVGELAALGVDLATLTEEDPPPTSPSGP